MHDDDALLIAAFEAGDEAAFLAFSRSVRRPLVGLVRRFVDAASVEDVVQQTWVTVLESLARFEGRSRLSTWVLQIALNLARTASRRAGKEVHLPEDLDPPEARFTPIGQWHAPPQEWSVATDDPEQAASNRELLAALERALGQLPQTWRAAVTLCDVEGIEPHEAAAVMDVEPGYLRVLLHRGRARLRESLEVQLMQPV